MRLLVLAGTAAVSLIVALPAQARTSLPSLFTREIRTVNAAPHAPAVLLPRRLPLGAGHLYASGGPSGSSYDLSVGAVANCHDADACFVADFSATKSNRVFGTRVTVRGAAKAGFFPLSCGASCSPPQIDFVVHGIRYTFQANLTSPHGNRATLIGAAQAAISAGPR